MERERKQYWKLPVVLRASGPERAVARTEQTSAMTAAQAQASDWISKVREVEATLLKAYGQVQYLSQYGQALGYVVITENAINTNLTAEMFAGENAGMDITEFCQAWAGLVANILPSVPDDLAALLMRNARGAL